MASGPGWLCVETLLARTKGAMENAGYRPKSTTKSTNHSPVPEVATAWAEPIQESNYTTNKSAMVCVYLSPATATVDMPSLPIQEASYDPTKAQMVTTIPSLPTYMKTATVTKTP